MESVLQKWLDSDASPADFYQLLGTQRFHPDKQHLLRSIRAANRVLHGFQNHPDPRTLQRARKLQMLLGQAEHTVSSDTTWQAYDDGLRLRLCEAYSATRSATAAGWRADEVRRWLNVAQDVHPSRLDRIVQAVMESAPIVPEPDSASEQSPPKTHQSRFFAISEARPRSANLPAVNPALSSPTVSEATPPEAPSQSSAGQQTLLSSSQTIPPPRPGNRSPGLASQISGSPPPRIPNRSGAFPTIEPVRRRASSNQAVFWIVGSAVASALVVGLIAAVVVFPRLSRRAQPAGESQSDKDLADTSTADRSDVNDGSPSPRQKPKNTASSSNSDQKEADETSSFADNSKASSSSAANDSSPMPANTGSNKTPPKVATTGETKPVTSTSGGSSKPSKKPNSTTTPKTPADPPQTAPASSAGPVDLPHGKPVQALAWNQNGTLVASGGDDPVIRIWDSSGKEVKSLTGHGSTILAMAWSVTPGNLIASASDDGTIRLWDIEKGAATQTISLSDQSAINALAWTKDGKHVVAADSHGGLTLWDSQTGKTHKSKADQGSIAGAVRGMATLNKSPAPAAFVTGHVDGSVIVWNLARSPPTVRMLLPSGGALWERLITTGSIPSGDSGKLSSSKSTSQPDAASVARRLHATPYGGERCFGVAMSSDDDFLALANGDVEIWDLSKSSASVRVRVLPGREGDVGFRTVAWQPQGKLLAAGDGAGELNVWDTRRWKVIVTQKFSAAVTALAWSPADEPRLAVASADGTTRTIPIGDGSSQTIQDPTFPIEEIVKKADEFAKDEDWGMLRRAVNLMDMYRLSSTDRATVEKHQLELHKAAEDLLESLSGSQVAKAPRKPPVPKSASKGTTFAPAGKTAPPSTVPPKNDFAEKIGSFQEVIDLDADGKAGKKARQLLEKSLE